MYAILAPIKMYVTSLSPFIIGWSPVSRSSGGGDSHTHNFQWTTNTGTENNDGEMICGLQ
ncbi:MAG: hypothetical protein IJU77_14240 [Butyrivibrio sp.]|nr:hypothetical protein [Butyrivibrio sp.]